MVEYGLLARGEDHRLAGEAAAIRTLLAKSWKLDVPEVADGKRKTEDTKGNTPVDSSPAEPAATAAKDQ
jgi:cytochrome c biogenesis protein